MIWLGLALAADFPFTATDHVLDNGLRVIVVPMDAPGVVATQLRMDVGSRNEIDAGRSGFAHFFEHLMFSDTAARTRSEREDLLVELGVRDGAWTSFDQTVYHGLLPSSSLGDWLGVMADSFVGLQLTEQAVKKESGAVYGEWRKGSVDPVGALFDGLYGTAFTEHPYEHRVIGHLPDIEAMPTAFTYAQTFATRWYRPERAMLVIAGDVSADDVASLAKPFEPWVAPPLEAPAPIPAEPKQSASRRVEVPWEDETSPWIAMAWKIPPMRPDADTATLRAIESLLLGPNARLRQRLVREEAIATSLWGGHEERVDDGLFTVVARVKQPDQLDRVEAIVAEELQRLVDEPPADALERVKTVARYRTLTGLDTPSAVAAAVRERVSMGLPLDQLGQIEENLAAVSVDDIATAVNTHLVPEHRTVAVLTGSQP